MPVDTGVGTFLRVAPALPEAAVKDRRRDQRATTTSRELVGGMETPSFASGFA